MAVKQLYPNQRPTLNLNFARSKTLDPRITFTRNSTATYVGSDGLIKTAADNEARFDHDPATGECLGLLIEESRTNYIEYSDDGFSGQGYWTNRFGNWTITTGLSAPDGTNTAFQLVDNGGGNFYRQIAFTTAASPNPTSVTWSFYAKYGGSGGNVLRVLCNQQSGTNEAYLYIDTGELLYLNGVDSISIEPAGNGWYRYSITDNNVSASTNIGMNFLQHTNATNVILWGIQIEVGGFSTSYIPTNGSTSQRVKDEVEITGTNFSSWYNGPEGTMVMDMIRKPVSSSGAYIEFYNNAGFFMQDIGSSFKLRIGTENSITLGNVTTTNYRFASGYLSASDFRTSVNGAAIQNNTTAVNFNNATELHIGRGNNAFTSHWRNGPTTFILRQFAFYPTRLSDTQLQELTR